MDKHEIRALRKGLGVNRKQFGELIGVSGRTVEKYELGTRKPGKPVIFNMERLKNEK